MRRRTGVTLFRFISLACVLFLPGCEEPSEQLVLPDPGAVQSWFGEGTEAEFEGNVLSITGAIEADYLRRGGRLWARSGPYFYLFNVHVQKLLLDYPDIAAVRATAVTESGEVLSVATLQRTRLNEARWREALARASLAQTEGTENPRLVERLIQFGEDFTDFRYTDSIE
jgi:hypothetical protein